MVRNMPTDRSVIYDCTHIGRYDGVYLLLGWVDSEQEQSVSVKFLYYEISYIMVGCEEIKTEEG